MSDLRQRVTRLEYPTFQLRTKCPRCGTEVLGTEAPTEPCSLHAPAPAPGRDEVPIVIERT